MLTTCNYWVNYTSQHIENYFTVLTKHSNVSKLIRYSNYNVNKLQLEKTLCP